MMLIRFNAKKAKEFERQGWVKMVRIDVFQEHHGKMVEKAFDRYCVASVYNLLKILKVHFLKQT